ncbi:MAG: hypothetical protein DSO07_09800 [Thermoproteota archaeon]|jgi:hypothetical protein|uniref:Uncharacterized protein n=1 Tax=Candidatus Methanodesulfokora washburnensis TaxID=2478471 RepID=A0A3R9PDR5_9CREN|nr:hypothetical protein [Candidatus Methanodesulfokores washburnensis]RSN73616.1 hypothetical protein D6D85_10135 [Candidatus Methanodesulfokores washburnensis]RZN58178.1 MAG: hypothetical protein EF810_07770 [Candidatus Methanodesulfokores washburnensis]TDA39844.1 MAG: hypothetical protein DSO07_09800 [Candidatus Korarchaeota archaeon]
MPLAHGLVVKYQAQFNEVVSAVMKVNEASNVYLEVINSKPRIAVFVGEKFFFRAENYLSVTSIAFDMENGTTILKIISTAGRDSSIFGLFSDFGSSRDYCFQVADSISQILGIKYEVVCDIDYLDANRSKEMQLPFSSSN